MEAFHAENLNFALPGRAIARSSRASATRQFYRTLISILKNFSTIFASLAMFFYVDNFLGAILAGIFVVYFFSVFFIQKYYFKIRNIAWKSTEKEGEITSDSIQNTLLIRQNFIENASYLALKNEFSAWNKYYMISNLLYVGLSIFSVFFLVVVIFYSHLCSESAKMVNFTKNLIIGWRLSRSVQSLTKESKIFTMMFIDLSVFFAKNADFEKFENMRIISDKVFFDNVSIGRENNKIGPISWSFLKKITALTGQNGIGKTSLGLALANLIKYNGKISAPQAAFIGKVTLDRQLSSGENSMQLLAKIANSEANLIILDEVLDCISCQEFPKIFDNFRKSTKQFLIITHNQEVLKFVDEIYKLGQNGGNYEVKF